jgi:hypothetical protein
MQMKYSFCNIIILYINSILNLNLVSLLFLTLEKPEAWSQSELEFIHATSLFPQLLQNAATGDKRDKVHLTAILGTKGQQSLRQSDYPRLGINSIQICSPCHLQKAEVWA